MPVALADQGSPAASPGSSSGVRSLPNYSLLISVPAKVMRSSKLLMPAYFWREGREIAGSCAPRSTYSYKPSEKFRGHGTETWQ
jgi:hypothetical protein